MRNFLFLLFLPVVFASCCNKTKLAEQFTQQQVFKYIGFEKSSWILTSQDDSLLIVSSPDDKGFSVLEKCSEISLLYNFDLKNDNNEEVVIHTYYNNETMQSDFIIAYFSKNNSIDFKATFNPSKAQSNNTSSEYFISDITLNDGSVYANNLVCQFENIDSTNQLYQIFIAPEVGPIRVVYSDGEVYDLEQSDSKLGDVDYFGFHPN